LDDYAGCDCCGFGGFFRVEEQTPYEVTFPRARPPNRIKEKAARREP